MHNKQWVEVRKGADYPTICQQFDISPVLARLIRNRGICDQTAIENYLYGSLSMLADPDTLPDCLRVTAMTTDGEVMAVQHTEHPTFGVQFHPESIMTPHGKQILRNFLATTSS